MNNLILLDPDIIERDGPVPAVVWDIDAKHHLRYEDIKADRYEEAIQFLRDNHFGGDILCRAVGLHHDEQSADEMADIMRFLLREECSIAMIDTSAENDDNESANNPTAAQYSPLQHLQAPPEPPPPPPKPPIVGVAIMKIMTSGAERSWSFLRLLTPRRRDSGCTRIVDFVCEMIKYSTALRQLQSGDPHRSVHLFACTIARHFKGALLKEQLLLNGIRLARSVGAQTFTWVCTSRNDAERARRCGLVEVEQKDYETYTDANGVPHVLSRRDPGEHYASLFAVRSLGPRAATSLGDYLFGDELAKAEEEGGEASETIR